MENKQYKVVELSTQELTEVSGGADGTYKTLPAEDNSYRITEIKYSVSPEVPQWVEDTVKSYSEQYGNYPGFSKPESQS